MSRSVSLNIVGLDDLNAALAALPKATQKNTLQRVLLKAAAPIQKEAQERAPSRPADAPWEVYRGPDGAEHVRQPGTLKALVEVGTKLTPNQARLEKQSDDPNFAAVYVGTRDRVAPLEEFGTMHARPTPFMRPAWENNCDAALVIIQTELATEINKAAARYAKKLAKARSGGG